MVEEGAEGYKLCLALAAGDLVAVSLEGTASLVEAKAQADG